MQPARNSPYREAAPAPSPRALENDLVGPALVLLCLVSLARVVAVFYRAETFGREASVALLLFIVGAACLRAELRSTPRASR